MVRKAVPLCLVLPLLGAGISYAAYTDELSMSTWPWRIGVLVALGCCTGLLLVTVFGRNEHAAGVVVVSLLVRNYVLMVALPTRIEKERGKRVLVTG